MPTRELLAGLARILGLALLLELCQLAAPLFVKQVLERVIGPGAPQTVLLKLTAAFFVLALAHALLSYGRARALIRFGQAINGRWLDRLFTHLSRLPMGFFEARTVGDVAAKFWSATLVQRTVTANFVEAGIDGLMAICTLTAIFWFDPVLAATATFAAFAYIGLRVHGFRAQYAADEIRSRHSVAQQAHLWETIAGIQSIKLGQHQQQRQKAWLAEVQRMFEGDLQFQEAAARQRSGAILITTVARLVTVAAGALAVLDHRLSIGALLSLAAYNELFLQRMLGLTDKLTELAMLRGHLDRIAELRDSAPEHDPVTAAPLDLQPSNASLRLENVDFSHGDSSGSLIRDLTVDIAPGECVAFVGPSGCGKSTLMRIMLGLIAPCRGRVLVAGRPLDQIRLVDFRSRIAAVTQEDRLFAGSIADNISFFAQYPEQQRIEACARAVGLHSEVQAFEASYATRVKDGGNLLSAGQRQRLLLARALYREPAFLFLDEATSNLDIARERNFIDYLANAGMTRIIISHRPQPLTIADRCYVYQDGHFHLHQEALQSA